MQVSNSTRRGLPGSELLGGDLRRSGDIGGGRGGALGGRGRGGGPHVACA